MKTWDRYIFGEFVRAFLFGLVGFTLILLLVQAFEVGKIVTPNSRLHYYLYLLFVIPQIVVWILPAALMFGVCFTVAQFTVSRELVALHSAGVSFYRAVTPILAISAMASILLFLVGDFLVSPANSRANEQEDIIKQGTRYSNVRGLLLQTNLRGRKGYYFVHFLDRQAQRMLGGVSYLEISPDGKPVLLIEGRTAHYEAESEGWRLTRARRIHFDSEMKIDSFEFQPEMLVRFPDPVEFFSTVQHDPKELNVFELLRAIAERENQGFSTTEYEVELHASLSFPLMCVILGVVGSIAGNMGSHRSGGPLIRALLISVITMLIYYLSFSWVRGLGTEGVIAPALASWGPTGLFIAVAALMIWSYRR